MVTILCDWNSEVSRLTVVSWCCGSPNDVTFRAFSVSHYHKVQVFIQPLQILFSANECKISVGLSVPTNSLTTFDLIKQGFNWHELTNRQLSNFAGLSVPTNLLTNFDLFKQEFNWHEPTNQQLTNFVGLSVLTNSLANFVLIKRQRFCPARRTSGVARKTRNPRAERAWRIVEAAPISFRFLCPSPPLLLCAPNQNHHATQANIPVKYITTTCFKPFFFLLIQ